MLSKSLHINSNFLVDFVYKCLEKRAVAKIDFKPISNEWGHFDEISKVINLIPESLNFKLKAKKEIFLFSDSAVPFSAIENLLKEFGKNSSYDLYAHIFQPRYRAHFTHSFLVGALGWWVLEHVCFEGKLLKEHYIEFLKKRYDFAGYDLWDVWWTVSLLHDIGYPLSLFWKRVPMFLSLSYNYPMEAKFLAPLVEIFTNKHFCTPLSAQLRDHFATLQVNVLDFVRDSNFDTKFRETIQEVNLRVFNDLHLIRLPFRSKPEKDLSSIYHDYLSDNEKVDYAKSKFKPLDHGIISGILIYQHLLENPFIDIGHVLDDPIIDLILSPVSFHNLKEVNKGDKKELLKFDLKEDFDIFFLRFIDQLQEWGRGIIIEKTNEILIESTGINIGPMVDDKINLKDLEIIYIFNNYRDVLKKGGWAFDVFDEDKRKSFKALRINGKAFEPKIKIEIVSEDTY